MIPVAIATIISLTSPHEAAQLERYEKSQVHMGTSFKIVFYATSSTAANRAFVQAFKRIQQLDQTLSNYKDDSELTRVCRQAKTDKPIPVSKDFWRVLVAAEHWHKRTEGAFDMTIGPLTQLWRRARRQKKLPPPDKLKSAKGNVGGRFVRLNRRGRTVQLLRPKMQLDPGGIAKGFATDEALKVLAKLGINRALVNGGGDISIGDPPPKQTGWLVVLKGLTPIGKASRPAIRLQRCGIATSGDVFQSVTIGGKTYSHIVNPKTGLGLTNRIAVSVIAPDGMSADALASAISVMGPKQGLRLATQLAGVEALIVTMEGKRVRRIGTAGFRTKPVTRLED